MGTDVAVEASGGVDKGRTGGGGVGTRGRLSDLNSNWNATATEGSGSSRSPAVEGGDVVGNDENTSESEPSGSRESRGGKRGGKRGKGGKGGKRDERGKGGKAAAVSGGSGTGGRGRVNCKSAAEGNANNTLIVVVPTNKDGADDGDAGGCCAGKATLPRRCRISW
jgi:hypothetical protein